MTTEKQMVEEIHRFVSCKENKIGMRGGFPKYMRFIGVCPAEAWIDTEGWERGIYVPDLISVFINPKGEVQYSSYVGGDYETLLSLYRLMKEGIGSP